MSKNVNTVAPFESTGRFIVTFREGSQSESLSILKKHTGLTKSKLMSSFEFSDTGVQIDQIPKDGGVVFERLGIAVVSAEDAAIGMLAQDVGDDSPILAVEPEGIMYALESGDSISRDYLLGFRDAADFLCNQAGKRTLGESTRTETTFADSSTFTWGLQACNVANSKYSGRGIRVAVLDTGLDMQHPDFQGRSIASKSFIAGVESAQDGHGHGTHCTGTACGPANPAQGPRYGVAHGAQIFIGKVLSDQGSGSDIGILAGIDWAVSNKCEVISMSLGADIPNTSVAYETAGQRALDGGTLIIAAAGNNSKRSVKNFGFVGRPANSRSILAVGALDSNLAIADFSARDTVRGVGTAVDIAAPGVAIYSSWPMPTRYRSISGTSMATPHVAGIAALWAQATNDRGASLWQRLFANAKTLSEPFEDVGRGLIQSP